jgi:hypothetical protein
VHKGRLIEFPGMPNSTIACVIGEVEQFSVPATGVHQQRRPQSRCQLFERSVRRNADRKQCICGCNGRSHISVGDRISDLGNCRGWRETKHVLHVIAPQVRFPAGEQPVKKAQGVTHRTVPKPGDGSDDFIIRINAFLFENRAKVLGDLR